LQQQNARGRELFCDRTNFKDSVQPYGHVQFQIRQTVSGGLNRLAVFDHHQRCAGNAAVAHLFAKQIVHRVGQSCGRHE
jgi:hypothetical protein